ncbi:g6642 [Coccomyxa viridis]|uniref:G6642 protein n=1 Tax=Coccomyxa viridis TaxID=1274662 RepID=A0ABP1G2E2_9CHLO
MVLDSIRTFPTSAKVCIITNQPELLTASSILSQYPNTSICGRSDNIEHPYMLAWAHRDVIKTAWMEGEDGERYSLFLYMEDDLLLTWRALHAWAEDENPYMAMWLASRDQLGHWMAAPEWGYLPETMSDLIREEAAWSVYLIESAEYKRGVNGFQRSLVWPYDPVAMKLDHIAEVIHIPNNKCKGPLPAKRGSGAPCTISFDDVLTP